jgi:hypothetical protein
MSLVQNGVEAAALAFELAPTLSPNGPVARGLCQTEHGYLTAIEEVLKIEMVNDQITDEQGREFSPNALISMNAWLLPSTFLELLKIKVQDFLEVHASHETLEIYLPRVINEFIETGVLQVQIQQMPADWFGITYAADLAAAKSQILALEGKQYPRIFSEWN